MIDYKSELVSCYTRIRQIPRFIWGRAWRLRSILTPDSEKQEALKYLQEKQKNLLFILGSGRSGTQLISDLLEQTGETMVFHEPNFTEDVSTMDRFRRDQKELMDYWTHFRVVEIYRRWKMSPDIKFYGEVNGTIRYHAAVIKELFPNAKLFLMVRDGRGVVRSVMGWPQFYNRCSAGAYALKPLANDKAFVEWGGFTRLEKMSWGWQETNEFLMRHIPENNWLQLEKISSDYEYCNNRFFSKIGVNIPREVWDARMSKKSSNASKTYGFPVWNEWSDKDKVRYMSICRDTMNKLGYSTSEDS